MEIIKARLQVRIKNSKKKLLELDNQVNYIVGKIRSPFDLQQFNALRGPVLHVRSHQDAHALHGFLTDIAKEKLYEGKQREFRRKLKHLVGNTGEKTIYYLME